MCSLHRYQIFASVKDCMLKEKRYYGGGKVALKSGISRLLEICEATISVKKYGVAAI